MANVKETGVVLACESHVNFLYFGLLIFERQIRVDRLALLTFYVASFFSTGPAIKRNTTVNDISSFELRHKY